MANRLQPLNLTDFTGGINLRRNQFQLADNESPDMLNVDIDPRGGFFTRKGWQRWNRDDIVDDVADWNPRNAFLHILSGSEQNIYVATDDRLFASDDLAVFDELTGTYTAEPHLADFAAWGDDLYVAGGRFQPVRRRTGVGAMVNMAATPFSEIEAPVNDVVPQAEFCEVHAGYLFVAYTRESGTDHPNRIRWSHPNAPSAFRSLDFQDLERGGGHITGLVSFQDHLLVFKTTSVWAMYGADDESWQFSLVSDHAGCPTSTSQSKSESVVYWFSTYDRGGVYAYNGGKPVLLSERLSPMFENVFSHENVFVSWAGRRLWVTVPWEHVTGSTLEPTTSFVFDDTIGEEGAWVQYFSEQGVPATVLDGPNTSGRYPLAPLWSDQMATFVTLDYIDDGYDIVDTLDWLGTEGGDDIVTDGDEIIALEGSTIDQSPFLAYYRTRWLHAGWPDRKKSWRRPTFICREVPREVDLIVQAFRNFDETDVHRTRTLHIDTAGGASWTLTGADEDGGFDWTPGGSVDPSGTGADWAPARGGSQLIRSGSLGLCRSVQLEIRSSDATPGVRWGVDGIVAKFVMRRFR